MTRALKTSSLSVELILTQVEAPDDTETFPQRVLSAIGNSVSATAAGMRSRCRVVGRFWGHTVEHPEAGMPTCVVSREGGNPLRLQCGTRLSAFVAREETYITFGKFDALFAVPMHESYWSNILRTHMACDHRLGEFLTIPLTEVGGEPGGTETQSGVEPSTSTEDRRAKPVLVWSLIGYGRNGSEFFRFQNDAEPRARRRARTSWLTELVAGIGAQSPDSDVFLSHASHFPLVVRTPLKTFDEVEPHLARLRGLAGVGATSTIVAVRFSSLWNESCEEIVPKSPLADRPLQFALLLKVAPSAEATVANRVRDDLVARLGITDVEQVKLHSRPHYWDVHLLFETRHVDALLHFLTTRLEGGPDGIDGIVASATIPYWELQGTTGVPSAARRVSTGPSAYTQGETEFFGARHVVPGEPTPGIVARRLYNCQFELEWLTGQVAQLRSTWRHQQLPGVHTFDLMFDAILQERSRLREIGIQLDRLASAPEASRELPKTWKELEEHENICGAIREELHCARAEFHERTEALQAVTNTEPYILFGGRSGVTDLVVGAAASLMLAYCGSWTFEQEDPLWRGLVVLSNRSTDWYLRPWLQVLHVPLYFKLHIHRRLLPLAHEAAHQVTHTLLNTNARSTDAAAGLIDWWRAVRNRARAICDAMLDGVRARNPTSAAAADHDLDLAAIRMKEADLDKSEILTDVLGTLSGGPGYLLSLYELRFGPSGTADARDNDPSHPPAWLRVLFLSLLWQEFGVDGASDPWLGGLHDVVSKHISQMGSAEDLVSEGLQDGFSPDWVERNWHRLYNHKAPNGNRLPPWLRSGHVFLMAVLLGEHGEVARSLVTWCANYSRRGTFLFYEPRDTGRFLASSVAEVNDRCRRVAERLTFGHQVVLDEDRRVIAAASMCRDMRRPAYPTARILHSLFYSDLGTQGQKTETSDSASVAGAGERRRS